MNMRDHVALAVARYSSGELNHKQLCMHLAEINDLVQTEVEQPREPFSLGCWGHKLNAAFNRARH
jgi:hypothetical protein